jgi:hypothetical protein
VYGIASTVGSGLSGVFWNKQAGDGSWATGTILGGWGGPNQVQLFHVDTTGTTTTYYRYVFGNHPFAMVVNVAASAVTGGAAYEPGDVIAIDTEATSGFALSSAPRSQLVAGVYAADAGLLSSPHPMDPTIRKNEAPLALVGETLVKVSSENGPIRVGDLLVTSSAPGYAMRADEDPKAGTILGKALQPLNSGQGKIMVLLTLR